MLRTEDSAEEGRALSLGPSGQREHATSHQREPGSRGFPGASMELTAATLIFLKETLSKDSAETRQRLAPEPAR